MAVAARPGPSDARVPCPLCGGLIHPIAGKCKHCKADLTTYHAARPSANAPLPALHPAPGANGHASGRASAHTAHPSVNHAVPMPVAPAYDASQPVLPPRPTSRSHAAEPTSSGLRSWPVLVIILATVAIVVAVVLMVWPSGRRDLDGKRTITPPPAPERMQTEPEFKPPPRVPAPQLRPAPPQGGAAPDPWSGQAAPPPPVPGVVPPDPPVPGVVPPDPAPDTDTADTTDTDDGVLGGLQDPFASPHTAPLAPSHGHLQLNGRNMMMLAMMKHLCQKMLQCSAGSPDTCDAFASRPSPPPANCPAADRCLRRIDAMSCGSQADDLARLSTRMLQLGDCLEAIRC